MSLGASRCPAAASILSRNPSVYSEARWGWCLPHSSSPSQTLGLDQGPVVLSLASWHHTVMMTTWAQRPQLLTPGSHFLSPEATGSWLITVLSTGTPAPIFSQVAVSVKDTPEPWPHNSPLSSSLTSLFLYPESAADPPSHPDPSRYPQYFPNSNTPSPPLRASLKLPYPKPFSNISLNIQAHEPTTFSLSLHTLQTGFWGERLKTVRPQARGLGSDHSLPSIDSTLPLIKTQLSFTEHHTTTRQTAMKNLRWNKSNSVSMEPSFLTILRWQLRIFSAFLRWWPWCTPSSEAFRYKIPHSPPPNLTPTPSTLINPFFLWQWIVSILCFKAISLISFTLCCLPCTFS